MSGSPYRNTIEIAEYLRMFDADWNPDRLRAIRWVRRHIDPRKVKTAGRDKLVHIDDIEEAISRCE